METVLRWMLAEPSLAEGKAVWENARRMSADEISAEANLKRLVAQRNVLRAANWQMLARNWQHSVFYQTDLDSAAKEFARWNVPQPAALPESAPLLIRTRDAMFRSELKRYAGTDGKAEEEEAFSLLRKGLTDDAIGQKQMPRLSVYADKIVWGRSPVRIDIAGGWNDTPPYCLMEGGKVINLAIELNGQPPLQTYVRPCSQPHIILRSIDLGASETIETYDELRDFRHVGSPFSIPKAALALAGFLPEHAEEQHATLREQLEAFGCGIELTRSEERR